MKDIIRAWDDSKSWSAPNQEIKYWREKYLHSLPKLGSIEEAAYVWNVFLSMPSTYINKDTPEAIYEDLKRTYEKSMKHHENK